MKRSHICPKCGGRDILRVPGKSGAYGAGNNIQIDAADLERLKEKFG